MPKTSPWTTLIAAHPYFGADPDLWMSSDEHAAGWRDYRSRSAGQQVLDLAVAGRVLAACQAAPGHAPDGMSAMQWASSLTGYGRTWLQIGRSISEVIAARSKRRDPLPEAWIGMTPERIRGHLLRAERGRCGLPVAQPSQTSASKRLRSDLRAWSRLDPRDLRAASAADLADETVRESLHEARERVRGLLEALDHALGSPSPPAIPDEPTTTKKAKRRKGGSTSHTLPFAPAFGLPSAIRPEQLPPIGERTWELVLVARDQPDPDPGWRADDQTWWIAASQTAPFTSADLPRSRRAVTAYLRGIGWPHGERVGAAITWLALTPESTRQIAGAQRANARAQDRQAGVLDTLDMMLAATDATD